MPDHRLVIYGKSGRRKIFKPQFIGEKGDRNGQTETASAVFRETFWPATWLRASARVGKICQPGVFYQFINKFMATFEDFQKIDIRVGEIIKAEDFPEAKKPAYKLVIDLGNEIGTKKSSVQLPANYSKEELIGKRILCVVNFPPRQIGLFISEVLTLGVPDGQGNCYLVVPDKEAQAGGRLY